MPKMAALPRWRRIPILLHITEPQACWAGTSTVIHWQSKPILEAKDKFLSPEVQPQSLDGGRIEPVTSMVQGDGQQASPFPFLLFPHHLSCCFC